MEINKDNLEKALEGSETPTLKSVPSSTENKDTLKGTSKETEGSLSEQDKMTPEEEIGFHKGSLNTLVNERNELFKMLQTVESIMQAHIKRLEELGVKIETKK